MKILLTGAAGFIGSCFLTKLNSMGIDEVWLVDVPAEPSKLPNLAGKKFTDYLTREALLETLQTGQLDEIDLVVHLGACSDTTEKDKVFLSKNNTEYSRTLLKWALARKKKFHYASSASIYGDGKRGYDDSPAKIKDYRPLNPYGESKYAFDKWIIEANLLPKVVGYRYFNVFGPNEYHKGDMRSMVSKAFDQINETGKVKLFASTRAGYADGSEERDFVYVKDVNEVMAYFVEHPDKTGIFNLGTGKARSFYDLIGAVFKALGKKTAVDFIPMPEKLKGQYQYFTQADLANLRKSGYDKPFLELEKAVWDYVQSHLTATNPHY